MSDKYQALIDSLRDHQNGGRRNECDEAARAIETLRAANARLQAWHDAVRSDPWWYDEHGNEIMFRPQPLAKE